MKRINGKIPKKNNNKKTKSQPKVKSKANFLVIFGILLLVIAFILISSMCNVREISIVIDGKKQEAIEEDSSGTSSLKITEEEIKSLSGVSIGDNMFKKTKSQIVNSIKANSYVQDVQVSKKLNGNLIINVTQRQVKYLINYAGAYIYIDSRRIYFRAFY